jgi:alkylation response protein AidB-like acyl-CoA dehydrogenase
MPEGDRTTDARHDLDQWRRTTTADSYANDRFVRRVIHRHVGARWGEVDGLLRAVAERTGASFDEDVREASRDENLPQLRRHDDFGRRIEQVVFHPAHHDAGRVFWSSGVLAALSQPGNEVVAGGIAYLLDQHGEAGHACPVACTAGAIKLLQRVGSETQRERYLGGLLSSDYDRRLHASQFVTELQGGSDVGANECRARPDTERTGWYRISGEKWFCSVADAGLFVVSARVDGAPSGTQGLGLFLVPRHLDGEINGFRLRRLKYKLGTRSMPTGEIEFDGALGESIGRLDRGFKNLVAIVLDTSRVHNALAACGIMRRSLVEAHAFASHRTAFGQAVMDYPAVQQIIADIKLRTMAAISTTFRLLALTDQIDSGEAPSEARGVRRIAVMINKYWTSVASTDCARDAIEVLGGNGTIEDFSVLPRLYRDAIVVESWEGTHNTLCAQVLRDFRTRQLHRPFLAYLRHEVEGLEHPELAAIRERAEGLLAAAEERIGRLVTEKELAATAHVRPVVDHLCRLTDWVALAGQLQWEKTWGVETDTPEALELYRLTRLDRADEQDHPELIDLRRWLSESV